ncbi:MAG: hypothetical protein L3J28_04670 [Candidatus Polarisedimenticolaceae bacterium]|nr:hypothetical protein [Candidatus Polarisedimenticolaceae bacterium]
MTVDIVEIIRRSDQGITKPFICRGDDDEIYFVKGYSAGRHSLFSEWIAGKLGLAMGLPIAPFSLVNVPEELLLFDVQGKFSDLGAGIAFGSCKQSVTELSYSVLSDIPVQTKRDLLVFDWWLKNGDRNYSQQGGNPNLFWQPGEKELVVIDHNQAFDQSIGREDFFKFHIFNEEASTLCDDFIYREEYNRRFSAALQQWGAIVAEIPGSWYFADNEMTVPANFNIETAFESLSRYTHDDFWNWL